VRPILGACGAIGSDNLVRAVWRTWTNQDWVWR